MPIRPLCFMVMPYGRKATQIEAGQGPGEIDFNALWDRVYVPVIEALGFEPVRADQDTGALIVTQMLERLYFADLVLADMTIPNGNVYYEIGIRHAVAETGCVLLAAEGSKPLFDLAQMRTVRYPLADGEVGEAAAAAAREAIQPKIEALASGASPVHLSLPGYPGPVDAALASTMKDQMADLAAFQGEVRAVRAAPRAERLARAQALAAGYATAAPMPTVALALLLLLRDCADRPADWNLVLDFIARLPAEIRGLPQVSEQRALALSYAGRHVEAVAALDALVATAGPTQERLGLLGGRYKRLWRDAADPADRLDALNRAIECYERGMDVDLNDYYCAGNLPNLYRARNRRGDEDRAQTALRVVVAACARARRRGTADVWLEPTLLVAAFDLGDADQAEAQADALGTAAASNWQIQSVIGTMEASLVSVKDAATRSRLAAVIQRLRPSPGSA